MEPTTNTTTQLEPQPQTPPKKRFSIKDVFSKITKSLWFRVPIGLFIILGMIFITLLIGTVTGIDLNFNKPFLTIGVLSDKGNPIDQANIILTNLTSSNSTSGNSIDGVARFTDLDISEYQIEVTAPGFERVTATIPVSRSFMNYSNSVTVTMVTSGIGSISGRFVTDVPGYSFVEDSLEVDGEVIQIGVDGSFSLIDSKTGQKTLQFSSQNFIDKQVIFDLESGQNPDLQDIELEPSAVLTSSVVSYLNKTIVSDLDIQVSGVSQSQIKIDSEGTLTISNLEVGREYTVRISKDGYISRDYTVTPKQGVNQIPNFRVTESGKVPFIAKDAQSADQIYISNYDGTDITQLTSLKNTNPYAEYLDGTIIYYVSDRDRVRNEVSRGNSYLVYAVSTQGGNAQRITTSFENFGRIIPNFSAKKLINISIGADDLHRVLEVVNLSGESKVEIDYITSGVFTYAQLSGNGAFVYYYKQNVLGTINGLYRANAVTGEGQKIFDRQSLILQDVSHDGDRFIYTSFNPQTKSIELNMYTVSTGQERTLFAAVGARTQFQFVGESRDRIIYQGMQAGSTNVFELNPDTLEEKRLTGFKGTEGVEAVYQQPGLILYQTNKGLYVSDSENFIPEVYVTNRIQRYTGYDF